MTTHEIMVTVAGFLCMIGSPILWRRWKLDSLIAMTVFFIGLLLVVEGHL